MALLALCISCKNDAKDTNQLAIQGTWKLISGMTIEKGDTILTDYTQKQEFIKLINATHFSFLRHDLTKGKGKDAVFSAGGGTYTLQGNKYSEFLQYCNYREWENNHFDFTLKLENDTLTQEGREKIDSLGVDRLNVEKYIRVK
jgi:hypothetical protein